MSTMNTTLMGGEERTGTMTYDSLLEQGTDLLEPIRVATALGAHLPVVTGMTVHVVTITAGSEGIVFLGAYATREDAVDAIGTWALEQWSNPFGWYSSSIPWKPETPFIPVGDVNAAFTSFAEAREKWVAGKTLADIAEQFENLDEVIRELYVGTHHTENL